MTIASSGALQAGLGDLLSQNSDLSDVVGEHVYDAVPSRTSPDLYVVIGEDKVSDASSVDKAAAVHEVFVSVISNQSGFLEAKSAAAAVHAALEGTVPNLSIGQVVSLRFTNAESKRDDKAGLRRINLRFRAFVEEN